MSQGAAAAARLGDFVSEAAPPAGARARAAIAVLDTVGVTLAGASEPASRIVRQVIAAEGGEACTVCGTPDFGAARRPAEYPDMNTTRTLGWSSASRSTW